MAFFTDVASLAWALSGASTAIELADLGADVIVIEKMSEEESGGNTRFSYGFSQNTTSGAARAYIQSIMKREKQEIPKDELSILSTFSKEQSKNITWLRNLGASVELFTSATPGYPWQPNSASFPGLPNAQSTRIYRISGPYKRSGRNLLELLVSNVKKRKIKILYSTRAYSLTRNSKHEITGVKASRGKRSVEIKTRLGVVLACGGYEHSAALKRQFFGGVERFALGPISNTGDGVLMSIEIGACLWHMQ